MPIVKALDMTVLPLKGMREKTYAAGEHMTNKMKTELNTVTSELMKLLPRSYLVTTFI